MVDSRKKRKKTKQTRSEKINGFLLLRAGLKQNLIREMESEPKFEMEGSTPL